MLLRQRGVTYLLSCDDNISRLGFVIRAKRVAEKIRGSPSEGVRNVSYEYTTCSKTFIGIALGSPPGLLLGTPLEALVDTIRPIGRGTHTRQARVGMVTAGKA